MMNTTTDCQLLYKLQAIESAERYLIARTRREIRAVQSGTRQFLDGSQMVLVTSAACMGIAILLVQAWPYIAASVSV